MKLVILATARTPQVMAALETARVLFPAATPSLLVPAKNRAAYAAAPCDVLAIAHDRFQPLPPPELAGLCREDLVVGILNNQSGHDADDLIRLLLSLPSRRFLFTFDGRLLRFGWKLRLRWILSGLWPR